jgi:alkylation response protein AidB-like acyl-CoA dehydrogenase
MNYFTENEDLQFILASSDLTEIIHFFEDDFRQNNLYSYAPVDIDDAMDNYRRILTIAGEIAAEFITPRSESIDREPNILKNGKVTYSQPIQECLRTLTQAELMGCTLSRRYGGLKLPNFVFTMIVEMIAQADASMQNIFGLQGIGNIIEEFADEAVKEKYLPLFASGQVTGAMALTEADAGSDLQNVKLKAVQATDGTWRLNGVKRFITNGNAEVLLVLARSEPDTTDGLGLSLFLCEGDATVMVRRLEDKLGIHGSPTCELHFKDTPAVLIGERQRGLVTYVLALLNGARVATAAQSIGIAQAAFNVARLFAYTRKQYGRRIETLPPVAEMLTDMKIGIETARVLNYEAARKMDLSIGTIKRMNAHDTDAQEKKALRKKSKTLERMTMLLTSLTKYYCSEMCIWVTRDAIQVLGGSGYMRDYAVERYYRDARITNIYEGTSQLQIATALRGILSGTIEKCYEECMTSELAKPLAGLAKKLEKSRKILSRSIEYLSSKKDSQLLELCARPVVDSATEIYIGYLLLNQARYSSRKSKVAKMYINPLLPRLQMRAHHIRSAEHLRPKDYGLIVGSVLQQ